MCIQGGLDGVAAEIKRWTAEGVTLPCSEILLGHRTNLPTPGKVCYMWQAFYPTGFHFIVVFFGYNWTGY